MLLHHQVSPTMDLQIIRGTGAGVSGYVPLFLVFNRSVCIILTSTLFLRIMYIFVLIYVVPNVTPF